jgi:cysteine desulfurase/selenocysteine lyase
VAEVSGPDVPGRGAVAGSDSYSQTQPGGVEAPVGGPVDVALLTSLANELFGDALGPIEPTTSASVPTAMPIPAALPGGTPDIPLASGPSWADAGFSVGSWPIGPAAGGLGTLPGIPTLPRSPFEVPPPQTGAFGPIPDLTAPAPWIPVTNQAAPASVPSVAAPNVVAPASTPNVAAPNVASPQTSQVAPAGGDPALPAFSPVVEPLARPAGPQLAPAPAVAARSDVFDAASVRKQFPILSERVHGRPLIWLDNGATTQKPQAVIDRISYFYEHENSNVHRGAHTLAARATDAYEAAREKVRRYLSAPSANEIVFVRGTTEGINLVAQSWGRRYVEPGDEILVTWLEHHANIVPWQQLAAEKGAHLRAAPVDDRGVVDLDQFERLLSRRTKMVAITHVSNAIGTINPVREMTALAHRYGARVLIDGAQSVSHLPVDVQAIGADFFVFSGHKVYGPTGIGALWGRSDVLDAMPPWQGGGSMIADVTFERTVYNPPPAKFEAGTGNIADAVGLGAALDWLSAIGLATVSAHEHDLIEYAVSRLSSISGLRILGDPPERAGALSFTFEGYTTTEVGTALDREGIAVRAGHHCAQPALRRFGVESSVRPSFGIYNARADIDALHDALVRLRGA